MRRLRNGAPDCKTTGPQHNHSKQGAMNIHEAAVLILVKLDSYFHQRWWLQPSCCKSFFK